MVVQCSVTERQCGGYRRAAVVRAIQRRGGSGLRSGSLALPGGDRMSNLVVISFEDEQQAAAALQTLRDQQKAGQIHINDTAVVRKDADGKVHVKNEVSSATEIGAVAGGALGLVLGFMFPIAGIAIGAAGGAAVGAMLEKGVDGKFVKDVSQQLEPGKSALFVVFAQANPSVMQALKPYQGKVLQTTLSSDLEERLRRAVNETPGRGSRWSA
jgi:uncharacterized membrane protein